MEPDACGTIAPMDIEQTLRILLEQQQRLGAHQERQAEDQRRLEGYLERIARSQLQLVEMGVRQNGRLDQVEAALVQVSAALSQLAEAHRSLVEEHRSLAQEVAAQQQRTDQRFQELAETQRHTDENLNALIRVVDDLIPRDGQRS